MCKKRVVCTPKLSVLALKRTHTSVFKLVLCMNLWLSELSCIRDVLLNNKAYRMIIKV